MAEIKRTENGNIVTYENLPKELTKGKIVKMIVGGKSSEQKERCQVCNKKSRYLFVTTKGAKICVSCLKLAGFEQKDIDKLYNVHYYWNREGAGSVIRDSAIIKERLADLF